MINLTGPSNSQPDGTSAPRDVDDRSDNAHRQLIGWIGLLIPWILILLAAARSTDPSARWTVLDSVSAYYYTGAVVAFVGMLVALVVPHYIPGLRQQIRMGRPPGSPDRRSRRASRRVLSH